MLRCRSHILAILLMVVPFATYALPGPLVGAWCAQDGRGVVYIKENSIGFNEHTVCDLEKPLTGAEKVETVLNCKNVYSYDGSTVEAFETTVAFSAELVSEILLSVLIDESAESVIYEFCGE